ncbi:MAG: UDP-N-acetylmuramoyl-tripeptide--D-alanyl-D-alanine ligase [Candidatus Methylacidiphilales bacterium]
MIPLECQQVARMAQGHLLQGHPERKVTGVSTDTRSVQPGDVFVALRGDRFDGHEFIESAMRKGALAVIVDRPFNKGTLPESMAVIKVNDTLVALQRWASAYRQTLSVRIAAVTGSNGKTSTKEMMRCSLGARWNTSGTKGNLNNHIGVPLTLLSIEENTEWMVMEMGMNHAGELRPLVEMAKPDLAVITGIGWAHIEHLGSREAIAEEKMEVVRSLPAHGFALISGNDPLLQPLPSKTAAKVIKAGWVEGCEMRGNSLQVEGGGMTFDCYFGGESTSVFLPIHGKHMASNALLALAAATVSGVRLQSAADALRHLKLPGSRLKRIPWGGGVLIDDSYNASPDSVMAGVETLILLPDKGRRVLLLGGMAELGVMSVELHEWVGQQVVRLGVDLLGLYGPYSEDTLRGALNAGMQRDRVGMFSDHESLAKWYEQKRADGDVVLVKGSRAMKMEILIENLTGKGE